DLEVAVILLAIDIGQLRGDLIDELPSRGRGRAEVADGELLYQVVGQRGGILARRGTRLLDNLRVRGARQAAPWSGGGLRLGWGCGGGRCAAFARRALHGRGRLTLLRGRVGIGRGFGGRCIARSDGPRLAQIVRARPADRG